jgi:hypothetical protein
MRRRGPVGEEVSEPRLTSGRSDQRSVGVPEGPRRFCVSEGPGSALLEPASSRPIGSARPPRGNRFRPLVENPGSVYSPALRFLQGPLYSRLPGCEAESTTPLEVVSSGWTEPNR